MSIICLNTQFRGCEILSKVSRFYARMVKALHLNALVLLTGLVGVAVVGNPKALSIRWGYWATATTPFKMAEAVVTTALIRYVIADLPDPGTPIGAMTRSDARFDKILLGKHKLSLQWISWDYFGSATIRKDGTSYSIVGEQRNRENADFLTIAGQIIPSSERLLIFKGKIITKVNFLNKGQPCERAGTFQFKATGTRKYWRLQAMDSPCDTATDYVDLYF